MVIVVPRFFAVRHIFPFWNSDGINWWCRHRVIWCGCGFVQHWSSGDLRVRVSFLRRCSVIEIDFFDGFVIGRGVRWRLWRVVWIEIGIFGINGSFGWPKFWIQHSFNAIIYQDIRIDFMIGWYTAVEWPIFVLLLNAAEACGSLDEFALRMNVVPLNATAALMFVQLAIRANEIFLTACRMWGKIEIVTRARECGWIYRFDGDAWIVFKQSDLRFGCGAADWLHNVIGPSIVSPAVVPAALVCIWSSRCMRPIWGQCFQSNRCRHLRRTIYAWKLRWNWLRSHWMYWLQMDEIFYSLQSQ